MREAPRQLHDLVNEVSETYVFLKVAAALPGDALEAMHEEVYLFARDAGFNSLRCLVLPARPKVLLVLLRLACVKTQKLHDLQMRGLYSGRYLLGPHHSFFLTSCSLSSSVLD